MTTRISETFFTSREAAAFLRLSPGTLANWRVNRKHLRFYRIGTRIRYCVKDLAKWALTGTCEVDPPEPTRADETEPCMARPKLNSDTDG